MTDHEQVEALRVAKYGMGAALLALTPDHTAGSLHDEGVTWDSVAKAHYIPTGCRSCGGRGYYFREDEGPLTCPCGAHRVNAALTPKPPTDAVREALDTVAKAKRHCGIIRLPGQDCVTQQEFDAALVTLTDELAETERLRVLAEPASRLLAKSVSDEFVMVPRRVLEEMQRTPAYISCADRLLREYDNTEAGGADKTVNATPPV